MRAAITALALVLFLSHVSISDDSSKFTMIVKVEKIKIESIELKDTKLSDAVNLIRDLCKKADPEGKGLNISFIAPKDDKGKTIDPVISDITLTNIPLKDLLRYVCEATGMTFKVDEFAVMIMPKKMAGDKMETRSYKVRPDVVDSIDEKDKNVSKDKK